MRPGGGKAKGSGFERDIAKELSAWISNGERSDLISRNVLSGGIATRQSKSGPVTATPGDLVPCEPHPLTISFFRKFMVECKNYRSLDVRNLLYGKPCVLRTFWDIAQSQAKTAGRMPLVIAKENNQKPLILLHYVPLYIQSWKAIGAAPDFHVVQLSTFLHEIDAMSYMEFAYDSHFGNRRSPPHRPG